MPVRKASAEWTGTLREGKGSMKVGSGAFEGPFSFGTRFEEVPGTNPEELIGAAQVGAERHRKTTRVRRPDQFLGIGAGLFLKAGTEGKRYIK